MSHPIWSVLAAVLWCAGPSATLAQNAAPPPVASPAAASPTSSLPSQRIERSYRSAFEGYRRYADQPVGSWREANDLVGRIGGWQAYAREAQTVEPAPGSNPSAPSTPPPAASQPEPTAQGAKPPVTPSSGTHAGHAGQAKP